jgi:hypothetical protein
MVVQFPNVRALRRAALAACHAELLAVTRTASALAGLAPRKKSPGRGGPEDRGLNRAWAARKRAQ